jgi:hypothetical protein
VRNALKAMIVANEFLESEVCELMQAVSHAHARGRLKTTVALPFIARDDRVAAGVPTECINPNAAVMRAARPSSLLLLPGTTVIWASVRHLR